MWSLQGLLKVLVVLLVTVQQSWLLTSHIWLHLFLFFFCFSLSFSAPRIFSFLCPSLSNTSSTLNSVLQRAPVHREGGLNNYIDKEKKIDPSGRITSPALIPLSCGLWISSFNSSCVLLMLRWVTGCCQCGCWLLLIHRSLMHNI